MGEEGWGGEVLGGGLGDGQCSAASEVNFLGQVPAEHGVPKRTVRTQR